MENSLLFFFSLENFDPMHQSTYPVYLCTKQDNVRNQLIQFELLLTAATFVVTIFAVVTGVFGMNFVDSVFERSSNFNLVLIITSISCAVMYFSFLLYVKHKRLLPS